MKGEITVKRKLSKKTKAVLSIALVVAVFITGAFAYLFTSDSKTNVFTVGKVDVKLYEEFDTNLNGEIEAGETYSTSKNNISIEAEDVIVPGQIVTKRPYVENTGTTNAWVYVTVGIPTSTNDAILMEDGIVQISGKDIDIPVKAYAIQEKYAHKDNYKDVWNAYFKRDMQEAAFGQEETSNANLSERIALFKILNQDNKNLDANDIVNTPNSEWESIGFMNGAAQQTVYKSVDGYDYYVFAYKHLLSADTTDNANISPKAFEGVKLIDDIGEIKPVALEYCTIDDNGSRELVTTEHYLPGDIVTSLYWDDSLAKNGYSFDWYDMETFWGEENPVPISAGFKITEDMAVVGDWTKLQENVLTSDYLTYSLYYDDNADSIYATITGADLGHKNYKADTMDIVIPSVITVTRTGTGRTAFNIAEGTFISIDDTSFSKFAVGETKEIYVKRMEGNTDQTYTNSLRKIAKNVFIGDNITFVGGLFANSNVLESVSISNTVKDYEASFRNCVNLKEINFPSLCTYIGKSICEGCTSLKTLNIAGGVQTIEASAFANCAGLTTIEVSGRVRSIEDSAFANCTSLQTLSLGDGLTTLGNNVTSGCSGFDVKYSGTMTKWCSINSLNIVQNHKDLYINGEKIEGELIFPRTVKDVPEYAFCSDRNITKVTVPGTVKNIGQKAFWNCKNVTELTLSNGVETIQQEAFANLGITESLTIPESITYLGKWSFCGLLRLEELTMLSSCNFSGNEVFSSLEHTPQIYPINLNLKKYNIGSKVTTYIGPCWPITNEYYVYEGNPNYASEGKILYTKNMETLIKAPTEISGTVTVPEDVKTINNGAFSSCTKMTDIKIADNCETIGISAFDNCTRLKNISLGKNIKDIQNSAFSRTASLQSFSVSEENEYYCDVDGVLYNKDITTLVSLPCKRSEYVMPDSVTTMLQSACQHANIKTVTLSKNLKEIPKWGFQSCTALTSIDIPESVTSIGYQAFQKNTALKTITGGENVGGTIMAAFAQCTSLSKFPESLVSVKSISQDCFYGCIKMVEAIIPEGVTNIGWRAFQGCKALEKLILPTTLSSVESGSFKDCISLKDLTIKGTTLGDYMFSGCTALETVAIPSTITKSGGSCFLGCINLKDVTIEEGAKALGYGVFKGCSSITEITIPASMSNSNTNIFENCTGLTKVTMNGSLTNDENMFLNCPNIKEVVLNGTLGYVGKWFSNHPSITDITIAEGVTELKPYAFSGCSGITTLTLPNSMSIVGDHALANCTGLTSITLPENVKVIANNVFGFCDNLTEINIQSSNVSNIQDNAFANLTHELTINFNGTTEKWYQLQGDRTYNQLGFSSGDNKRAPVKIVCTNGTVTYALTEL